MVSARRGLSVEGQVLGASALLSENHKGWIRAGFLSTALALCTMGPERSLLWRDHLVHIGCLKASEPLLTRCWQHFTQLSQPKMFPDAAKFPLGGGESPLVENHGITGRKGQRRGEQSASMLTPRMQPGGSPRATQDTTPLMGCLLWSSLWALPGLHQGLLMWSSPSLAFHMCCSPIVFHTPNSTRRSGSNMRKSGIEFWAWSAPPLHPFRYLWAKNPWEVSSRLKMQVHPPREGSKGSPWWGRS